MKQSTRAWNAAGSSPGRTGTVAARAMLESIESRAILAFRTVRGPVLFCALRRLASMRFCEIGGFMVFSGDIRLSSSRVSETRRNGVFGLKASRHHGPPTRSRAVRGESGFVISRSNSVMVGMRTMRKAGSQERGESCFDDSCIPAFLSAAQLVLIAFGGTVARVPMPHNEEAASDPGHWPGNPLSVKVASIGSVRQLSAACANSLDRFRRVSRILLRMRDVRDCRHASSLRGGHRLPGGHSSLVSSQRLSVWHTPRGCGHTRSRCRHPGSETAGGEIRAGRRRRPERAGLRYAPRFPRRTTPGADAATNSLGSETGKSSPCPTFCVSGTFSLCYRVESVGVRLVLRGRPSARTVCSRPSSFTVRLTHSSPP